MVYYRLTPDDISGKIIDPKIPSNFMTSVGAEDNSIPRICVCPSIDLCILAVPMKTIGMEYYVNMIDIDESSLMIPDSAQVPDQKITKEAWIIDSIEMECIGKIKLLEVEDRRPHRYDYYNAVENCVSTGYLYHWSYLWLEGQIPEQTTN
ncbi:MAG: hypothetical protein NC548_06070 [Lachnospiraceae bacterium]|nr:hypothetical protein [Lachnospiraceae bacterium]